MQVVLTNDDGFDAPGMIALWRALQLLGDLDLQVIAPAEPHSGKGHAFTDGIRVRRHKVETIGSVLVIEGTPADCVCVAAYLPGLPKPDWIVSGINRGGNLGVDLHVSGTAAAARQSAVFGIPAVAISQLVKEGQPDHWEQTSREAAAILAALLRPGRPAPKDTDHDLHGRVGDAIKVALARVDRSPYYWNINLPIPTAGQPIRDVRLVPPSRDPVSPRYECVTDPDGQVFMRYRGAYYERIATPGTDVEAAFGGAATISRIPL